MNKYSIYIVLLLPTIINASFDINSMTTKALSTAASLATNASQHIQQQPEHEPKTELQTTNNSNNAETTASVVTKDINNILNKISIDQLKIIQTTGLESLMMAGSMKTMGYLTASSTPNIFILGCLSASSASGIKAAQACYNGDMKNAKDQLVSAAVFTLPLIAYNILLKK